MKFNELHTKLRDFGETINEQQCHCDVRLGVQFPDGTLRLLELDDIYPTMAVRTSAEGIEAEGGEPFILLNPPDFSEQDGIHTFYPHDMSVCGVYVGYGLAKSAFEAACANHLDKFMQAETSNARQVELEALQSEAENTCNSALGALRSRGRPDTFVRMAGETAMNWIQDVINVTLQPLVNKTPAKTGKEKK